MLTRRQLLTKLLQGSSLVALSDAVPEFVSNTARAAENGKDTILVVLELTGGNDGLNTVIPFADDNYQKARPKLRYQSQEVVRIDTMIGLNPGLRNFSKFLNAGQLAIVQGVGYPNPNRSHFQSMDVWHSADPTRQTGTGWLGRSLNATKSAGAGIPAMHIGTGKFPLALSGASTSVPTVHPARPFELRLAGLDGGTAAQGRMQLIRDVTKLPSGTAADPLLQFVQQTSLETYTAIDELRDVLNQQRNRGFVSNSAAQLNYDLTLISQLIRAGFGTRIFYVATSGFDTHADQRTTHQQLLQRIREASVNFFQQLKQSGHADRVVLLTFSEFGRRVKENGSRGTDHGSGSCLFVVGPKVKSGVFGKHPSLAKADLEQGDVKYHTDFRQVYATLLDRWLRCNSREVLGNKFEPLAFL